MFRRGAKPNRQKEFIGRTSLELVPEVGDQLQWTSPLIGRFILSHLELPLPDKDETLFQLSVGHRMDMETRRFPLTRLYYLSNGDILAAIDNTFDPADTDFKEVKSSFSFQIDNCLFVPSKEDYKNLENYLNHAKMDAVNG